MDHHSDDGSVYTAYTSQSAKQGNTKHELSIIEELDLKFGSAKNKHQILHALDHSSILHRIPLPTPNTTTEQARKDFRRERVLLNDVPFIPDKTDVDRCNAFSMTLSVLLERMMRRRELYDAELYPDAEAISDAVMQRACRTGAGADSFFMVQKLLCVEGTFVTQRTFLTDPPIKIDVFVADASAEPSNSSCSNSSSARKLATCRTGYSMESAGSTAPSRAQRSASGATETAAVVRVTPAVPSSRHSTPPTTPPHTRSKALTQEKYTNKILHASPLKVSLRNLGLMSQTSGSGRPFPSLPETGGASDPPLPSLSQPSERQGLGASIGSSGVAFLPPSSPTTTANAATGLMAEQNSHNSDNNNYMETSAAKESSFFQSPSSSSTIITVPTELTHHQQQQSCGAICARIQVMNCFAVYDVSAIEEITGVAEQDPDPWLEVEAIVVDETNFRTDQHWRKLQLIATCPASGKVYTSTPDAHSASRVSGRLSGRMVLKELKSWFTPLASISTNSNNNNHNNSQNSLLPQHGSARHTGKSSAQPAPSNVSSPLDTAATVVGSSVPASTAASMSVELPTSLAASSVDASNSGDGKSSSTSTQSGNVFAVSLSTNSPCHSVRVESGLSDSGGDRFSSGSHTAVVNPHIQLRDAALAALMTPSPTTSPRVFDDPVSVLMQLGARGLDDSALCTDSFSSCSGSLACTDAATDTGTDRGGSVLGDESSIGTADYNTGTEGTRLSAGSGGRSIGSTFPVRTIEELDLLMSSTTLDGPRQCGSAASPQYCSDDEASADVSGSSSKRRASMKKVS